MRIGVLGCGPIAQFAHFDACRKARNAELYAICDVAEDLRSRMAAIHQPVAVYSDYDEMLADPKVDAVIIAVSDQFHVPLCKAPTWFYMRAIIRWYCRSVTTAVLTLASCSPALSSKTKLAV